MNIRCYIAFICAKLIYVIMKICKRNASHFPGNIALKICPNYLERINRVDKIICVTGTDGKTSTANLITEILQDNEYKVVGNRLGSNTIVGIATAMTNALNIFGKPKANVVVLEVDEHYTRKIFPFIKPDYLVVTNLLRDSLKRNAHPEYIFNKINDCKVENMKVILNADELCSSNLLPKNKRIYFGIDKLDTDLSQSNNIINDYKLCPNCSSKLVYDYVKYAHVGKMHCPKCEFKSYDADYIVTSVDNKNEKVLVKYKNQIEEFPLINKTIFNIYNEIATIALLLEWGLPKEKLYKSLKKVKITETRFSENKIKGINIVKIMAKGNNSLPVSLVFDYVSKQNSNKIIILALDDMDVSNSSEYIGWIYDADYEFLNKDNIKQIIISGKRCYDHKIRALLAGIPQEKMVCNMYEKEAIKKVKLDDIQEIYILHDMSTYKESVEVEKLISKIIMEEK